MGYVKFLLYLTCYQGGKLADNKAFLRDTCLVIKQELSCIGLFNPDLWCNYLFQSCEMKQEIFLKIFILIFRQCFHNM